MFAVKIGMTLCIMVLVAVVSESILLGQLAGFILYLVMDD